MRVGKVLSMCCCCLRSLMRTVLVSRVWPSRNHVFMGGKKGAVRRLPLRVVRPASQAVANLLPRVRFGSEPRLSCAPLVGSLTAGS